MMSYGRCVRRSALTIKTLWALLLDKLGCRNFLEVDSNDLSVAKLLGKCESHRNRIDNEDLGCSLEQSPLHTGELMVGITPSEDNQEDSHQSVPNPRFRPHRPPPLEYRRRRGKK